MNLTERGELIGFLRKHGLTPDKGLGQHFLCSRKVTVAILGAVGDASSIVEIGPGPGTLTQALSSKWQVTAIEKDPRMLPPLAESSPRASIEIADALYIDLGLICAGKPQPVAVVSNMPYNITGPLLAVICGASETWTCAILMMQREVGHKLLAKAGKSSRGAISVRMQAEFEITKVCDVPPGAFLPPPKVDSVVLKLVPKSKPLSADFVKFVQAGFAQPRKTLANNLHGAGFDRLVIERVGLPPSVRPHELTQGQWEVLYAAATGPI